MKECFPLVLELFPRIYRNVVADSILQFPNLDALHNATDAEILTFFRSHCSHVQAKNGSRLELIRKTTHLVTDSAVIESNSLLAQAIAREIKAINESMKTFEEKISSLYSQQKDREIFDSLPGVGEVMGPRLLTALGTNRSPYSSAQDLQRFSGIAPVIERSGQSSWTHWRLFRTKQVSQAFVDFAFLSVRPSFWAEAFDASQRAKGKSHNVAMRALAFKWIRIIFVMWKTKTPYNEARYLRALNASGSHLEKNFKLAA